MTEEILVRAPGDAAPGAAYAAVSARLYEALLAPWREAAARVQRQMSAAIREMAARAANVKGD